MTWDYIVVGAGSAGCVIAARLSENPAHKVLLLNAGYGGLDRTPFVTAPAAAYYTSHNPVFDWNHRTEQDASSASRAPIIHNGKITGGGGAINGMMFIRGSAGDFDEWAELGNEGWSYRDVLPFFRKMEHTPMGSDEFHGRDGPVGVDYPDPLLDVTHRFIEAATEAGIPYNSDINGATNEGVTRTPSSIFNGVRQSTAQTYLHPALKRRNLKILSGASVHRVLFDGKDAIGVEYRKSGKIRKALAAKETILCAGGVKSPQILMLSGVGPEQTLRDVGIPVVHPLEGVGQNYMDHASVRLMYSVTLPTWSKEMVPHRQAMHGLNWLFRRKGLARSGVSQAVAFVRTDKTLPYPDVQISLLPLAVPVAAGRGKNMMMLWANECKPTGRGTLTLSSADPEAPPKITPSLLSGNQSIDTIIKGIRIARGIMEAGAIRPYVLDEALPGREVQTDAEMERWIRETALSMCHQSGTCKMGQDEAAVVDARLRVRGVGRLRIADASIMPTIPSGNINAPTIMIGEKAAAMILEDAAG
ncbi:choline dehydrogenase [Sphingobium amiense]|uniref:Choline dehydrogenase n=1 Tax=Sphingobium amiense TaxID=135719 RepID=A0A494W8N8_9SPHN|nr:GMC family oxidoreductase N-terminal domain-containing protein [Sphingobium amiense]BBD96785.1 choline dehydrogenase [Sphingobium amiense]